MNERFQAIRFFKKNYFNATEEQKAAIEKLAQTVLDARAKDPDSSLADLYNPLTMPPDLQWCVTPTSPSHPRYRRDETVWLCKRHDRSNHCRRIDGEV
jgi:hypothetical protein